MHSLGRYLITHTLSLPISLSLSHTLTHTLIYSHTHTRTWFSTPPLVDRMKINLSRALVRRERERQKGREWEREREREKERERERKLLVKVAAIQVCYISSQVLSLSCLTHAYKIIRRPFNKSRSTCKIGLTKDLYNRKFGHFLTKLLIQFRSFTKQYWRTHYPMKISLLDSSVKCVHYISLMTRLRKICLFLQ